VLLGVISLAPNPFWKIISPIVRAVPDEAMASVQPVSVNSLVMVCSSARAASSALSMREPVIFPSAKKRWLWLTLPMYRLSVWIGSMPAPMMHSVEPPPMSITSRRSSETGSPCATPR